MLLPQQLLKFLVWVEAHYGTNSRGNWLKSKGSRTHYTTTRPGSTRCRVEYYRCARFRRSAFYWMNETGNATAFGIYLFRLFFVEQSSKFLFLRKGAVRGRSVAFFWLAVLIWYTQIFVYLVYHYLYLVYIYVNMEIRWCPYDSLSYRFMSYRSDIYYETVRGTPSVARDIQAISRTTM